MKDFYERVYSQDNPEGDAHGWIQWKGTDVCIDLHCKCGYHGHWDGDFLYFYECPKCRTKYALGQNIRLIELTQEQSEHAAKSHVGFKSDEPDDDDE